MSKSVVGPYRTVGEATPFYLVQLDKAGGRKSPQTTAHALEALQGGGYDDVFLFSHGWNNDWDQATANYDRFIRGYEAQSQGRSTRRAMLLGIFWPSAVLVLPDERAPRMAGAGEANDLLADGDLLASLDHEGAARVRELCRSASLDSEAALELAELLGPLYATDNDELGEPAEATDPEGILQVWLAAAGQAGRGRRESFDETNEDWGVEDGPSNAPQPAASMPRLDPRDAIRAATVWVMKDRAGRVGSAGVGPLLSDVLEQSSAQIHLIGHSFGAKVVLTALCSRQASRPVHSVLLLQPAVNHYCFAETVPGTNREGGFRSALARVDQPIMSTYSRHDQPLTRFFHLALRRRADLGEPAIAAWPEPPSRFAALGGYGPRGADADTQWVSILEPPEGYVLDGERKLAAVDGTNTSPDTRTSTSPRLGGRFAC